MSQKQSEEFKEVPMSRVNKPKEVSKDESEQIKPIVVPVYNDKKEKKLTFIQKQKLRKEERKKQKALQAEKKKEKLLKQTPDLLPFLQINEDFILLKNGVMDIFQVESKDLYSQNEEGLNYLMLGKARLHRSYFDSIKIVAMNFPSNTNEQKEYWLKKREQTSDSIRLQFINRKLFELDFLEKERTNREFFLFVYADTKEQIEERKKQIVRIMQTAFPLKELSVEKKKDVLFMLNNPNSKI